MQKATTSVLNLRHEITYYFSPSLMTTFYDMHVSIWWERKTDCLHEIFLHTTKVCTISLTHLTLLFIWLILITVWINCGTFLLDMKSRSVRKKRSRMMWRRNLKVSIIPQWLTGYWRDIKSVYHTMSPNCTVRQLLKPDLFLGSTFWLFLISGVMSHHQDLNPWPHASQTYKGTWLLIKDLLNLSKVTRVDVAAFFYLTVYAKAFIWSFSGKRSLKMFNVSWILRT